jgi:LysR family hydrogen peroxide-inducible transcriptional activator
VARRHQIKTLAKSATSRRIAIAIRRTYVKTSIIAALEETINEKIKMEKAAR